MPCILGVNKAQRRKYGIVALLQNMLSLQRPKALSVAAVAPYYVPSFGFWLLDSQTA
jgi:hypothetical protein